jgi:hypothetical protein
MAIHLRWEHEPDCRVGAELLDQHSVVGQFLADSRVKDFPYLRFIDHHSHTVFHQRHIPQLIEELETLSKQQHEPAVAEHLRAVLEFVRQAEGCAGSYIRFYAD